jgi:pimeloyl-ACP methyl ester carboxylesterase
MPTYLLTGAKYVLLGLATLYVLALAALYFFQERILFPVTPLPADHRFRFDGQRFEEMAVRVPGATLSALHFMQPDPRGLVFFIHGNGGNLETWTTGVDFYRRANYDLFIFDFRGYGKSTGRIRSEDELHADVRAAFDAIAPRYRGKPIVVYGRSLGTALAVQLATQVTPDLVVLVTPYTSVEALARRIYPWAPARLLKYPLRADALIGAVRSPLLLLHGTRDELIPFDESRKLLALARSPAELVTIDGASHNDIHEFPLYLHTLKQRLASLPAAPPP